jgi:hypothetical protein
VNRTFSQFKVAGKGWSFDIGGGHFDSVLIEKFATAFNEAGHLKNSKEGDDVRKIPRAMAKLRKNVQKVCRFWVVFACARVITTALPLDSPPDQGNLERE